MDISKKMLSYCISTAAVVVIYSEDNVAAPYVPSFDGESPLEGVQQNVFIRMFGTLQYVPSVGSNDAMQQLVVIPDAHVLNGSDPANFDLPYNSFYEGKLYITQYPLFYLQSGLFEHQADALSVDPSCDSLEELHKLTNGLGAYDASDLPFGGFRRNARCFLFDSSA
eukprot:228562_1